MAKHLFFSLALAVLVLAEPAARQQTPPTFRSGAQIVEIDVRVFDKDGRFVTGLTRDDFELVEDGAPQQLQTFFFVDDPGSAGGARPGPDPGLTPANPRPRQTWIFFFDLHHLTPGGGYDRARKAVEDFIRDRFQDGDLGGILAGDRMINNRLTSVRAELLDGVKQVKPLSDARSLMMELTREWPRLLNEEEAIRVARNEREAVQRAVGRACSDDPDMCRFTPPDAAVLSKGQRMQQAIHRASRATLSAIDTLTAGLAKVPGPKTVVVLSDGFVVQDIEGSLRTAVGQAGHAGARVYSVDVRGLNRAGNPGIIDQAQVDNPHGATASFDSIADGPNSLAIDTGGLMIRNENNIGRALETIAADANRYYVLGFQPANTTWDGRFRAVQVRVRRGALRVRARKGYLALAPSRMTLPQPVTPSESAVPAPGSPAPAGPPAPADRPAALPGVPGALPAPPAGGATTGGAESDATAGVVRIRPDAERRIRELSTRETGLATKLATEGWTAYQRGDLEGAIGPLTRAADQPGVRPWVLYALGLAQVGLERPREAIASWTRVREAAPDFEPVYMDLAATFASLADLTSALAVLRDAEQRWPNDPEVHNAIGVIHFRRGALDEAIAAFTKATAAAPEDALAYLNLGRAYELSFTRSRRYVTSQRRWVVNEEDRRKGIESYQAYIRIGGPYLQAANDGLRRLEWSK